MPSLRNSPVPERLGLTQVAHLTQHAEASVVTRAAKSSADRPTEKAVERAATTTADCSMRCTIPPLHWWRLRPLAEVGLLDIPMLTRCIRGFTMLGEPRWGAAETGDVAAAIAVALKLLRTGRFVTPAMDLAGTALLIAAARGDVTARLVLDHLSSLEPDRHRDPGTSEVATAVHQLQRLLEASMEVL
jgi:hypothetical protein